MPSRYRVREFAENEYYHVFNKGLQKEKIFLDKQDREILLYYLRVYLVNPDKIQAKYPRLPLRLQAKNLNSQITLIAYCLMPNHFHFLLKQTTKDAISKLMRQIINAYTLYFNKKYTRTGPLFEGRYKAVRIPSDNLLLHIARYIHLNPVVANLVDNPENFAWSSHKDYIMKANSDLISSNPILGHFKSLKTYQQFINDQITYGKELEKIKHLILD